MLGVFDLDVRLFFSILAQKRPAPARPTSDWRRKLDKRFKNRVSGENDLDKFMRKSFDSSCKNMRTIGWFCVTLKCSYCFRMVLVVKASKTYARFTTSTRVSTYNFQSYSEERVRGFWHSWIWHHFSLDSTVKDRKRILHFWVYSNTARLPASHRVRLKRRVDFASFLWVVTQFHC